MKTQKVDLTLGTTNQAMLSSRKYNGTYTDLPNQSLPSEILNPLKVIYSGLTNEELELDNNTFVIMATNAGTFKKVLSPTVFSNKDEEKVFIKWGNKEIELKFEEGLISTKESNNKVKFSFTREKVGKYDTQCLMVSVRHDEGLTSMPFPVRLKDLETSSDILSIYSEESDLEKLLELIGPVPSGKSYVFRPQNSYLVKQSQLPVGEYKVLGYWDKETKWGPKYYMTVKILESFMASTRVKNEDTGEWESVDVEINEYAIVSANSWASRVLAAQPIISQEDPATLVIDSHYQTNDGKNSCKGSLLVSKFTGNTIDLPF